MRSKHVFGIHAKPPVLGSMQLYKVRGTGLDFGDSFISLDKRFFTVERIESTKRLFEWDKGRVIEVKDQVSRLNSESFFIGISIFKYWLLRLLVFIDMRGVKPYHIIENNCMSWALSRLKFVNKDLGFRIGLFETPWAHEDYYNKVLGVLGERKMRVWIRLLSSKIGVKASNVPEMAYNIKKEKKRRLTN